MNSGHALLWLARFRWLWRALRPSIVAHCAGSGRKRCGSRAHDPGRVSHASAIRDRERRIMRLVHNVAVIRCLSRGARWSKSEHARLFDIIPLPRIGLIIWQVIHRQGRQSGRFQSAATAGGLCAQGMHTRYRGGGGACRARYTSTGDGGP